MDPKDISITIHQTRPQRRAYQTFQNNNATSLNKTTLPERASEKYEAGEVKRHSLLQTPQLSSLD